MKRRRLTEILIETVETIIVRRPQRNNAAQLTTWCQKCSAQALLITPDRAAIL